MIQSVLVITHNPAIAEAVANALRAGGYRPVHTGLARAVRTARETNPVMALADMRIGAIDRRSIRWFSQEFGIPVILLAERGGLDVARAFGMGAWDCVTDPGSEEEILARVRETLRHHREGTGRSNRTTLEVGGLRLDRSGNRATVAGEERKLTVQEFNLLWELASHAGTAVRHERLIERLWEGKHEGNLVTLRQTVKNLRRKLGDDALDPTHIATVHRVGYRMNV
jgi:DNA-binding response OmpR family regulator